MAVARQLSRADRESIRLRFFREFRGRGGCASVGVRTDRATGAEYLSVGVSAEGRGLPEEYEGLRVRTHQVAPAMHAVQYSTP
jgi:hypothetical protein